ncbi:hypothetical protein KIN20_007328 [Parelaphostrongylus tenuis]|uniref:Uncharacterized protein n=1 Tax=Parelaphostrongylus tenuis TaxID=148309 RepID=A0AAD5QHR7_PARTN|nr:hypothetical protein KIN20_007328 [Parelaphostrongylus tenuis]
MKCKPQDSQARQPNFMRTKHDVGWGGGQCQHHQHQAEEFSHLRFVISDSNSISLRHLKERKTGVM